MKYEHEESDCYLSRPKVPQLHNGVTTSYYKVLIPLSSPLARAMGIRYIINWELCLALYIKLFKLHVIICKGITTFNGFIFSCKWIRKLGSYWVGNLLIVKIGLGIDFGNSPLCCFCLQNSDENIVNVNANWPKTF